MRYAVRCRHIEGCRMKNPWKHSHAARKMSEKYRVTVCASVASYVCACFFRLFSHLVNTSRSDDLFGFSSASHLANSCESKVCFDPVDGCQHDQKRYENRRVEPENSRKQQNERGNTKGSNPRTRKEGSNPRTRFVRCLFVQSFICVVGTPPTPPCQGRVSGQTHFGRPSFINTHAK